MKRILVTSAVAAMAASSAQAMDWWGVDQTGYFAIKGGTVKAQDVKFDTYAGALQTGTDTGWTGSVAVGGYLNSHIRAELEGQYTDSDLDKVDLYGVGYRAGGDARVMAGMVNVYYDLFTDCRINPYLGVGAGVANVKFGNYRGGHTTFTDDDDTAAAGQLIAGMRANLTPGLAATLEYRYFTTSSLDIDGAGGGTDKVHYRSNNVMLGLQKSF